MFEEVRKIVYAPAMHRYNLIRQMIDKNPEVVNYETLYLKYYSNNKTVVALRLQSLIEQTMRKESILDNDLERMVRVIIKRYFVN